MLIHIIQIQFKLGEFFFFVINQFFFYNNFLQFFSHHTGYQNHDQQVHSVPDYSQSYGAHQQTGYNNGYSQSGYSQPAQQSYAPAQEYDQSQYSQQPDYRYRFV